MYEEDVDLNDEPLPQTNKGVVKHSNKDLNERTNN
jgi:hypothetical protein